MPNFVKVDSKPFHPDTYVGPEHEEDFLGGTHERDMGIKLRVENTVRWRWTKNKDDQDVSRRVSLPNTRVSLACCHSIGSQTLILSDGRMAP